MDIEMVYERGMDAEYWLNNGIWTSLSQARRSVPRMLDLSALQTGKLYNRDKRVADNGANDYWESGVIKPDVVLADLIRIFHPQLLPDHELVYYRKLQ
jgi:iron complex transport system substrate-binding protein